MRKARLTLTLDAGLKRALEELAGRRGIKAGELLLDLAEKELIAAGVAVAPRPERSAELVAKLGAALKGHERHLAEGWLNLEVKAAGTLLYTPEMWYFSPPALARSLRVGPALLLRALARLGNGGYKVFNPEAKDAASRAVAEQVTKTLNLYALGDYSVPRSTFNRLFGTGAREGRGRWVLVRKINPLSLKKFCAEHAGKKVVYILDWP